MYSSVTVGYGIRNVCERVGFEGYRLRANEDGYRVKIQPALVLSFFRFFVIGHCIFTCLHLTHNDKLLMELYQLWRLQHLGHGSLMGRETNLILFLATYMHM